MNGKIVEVGNDEDDTGPWVWLEYEDGNVAKISISVNDARKLASHLYELATVTIDIEVAK